MNKENERKIPTYKFIQIIIGLFCFLVLSLLLNLFCILNLVNTTKQISEIGAENIQLQNEIEYYKNQTEYFQNLSVN